LKKNNKLFFCCLTLYSLLAQNSLQPPLKSKISSSTTKEDILDMQYHNTSKIMNPSSSSSQLNTSIGSTNAGQQQQHSSSSPSLLSSLDFKAIDEMDPSLSEGHRIVFDKEIPVELRAQDPADGKSGNDVGTLEGIRVKILTVVCTY
jgi:hypothetical protein